MQKSILSSRVELSILRNNIGIFMEKFDKAQVGIIAAVLIAALIAIILVIIQIEYVPNWMSDKESEHMDLVKNQLGMLKSNIDTQCTDRSLHFPLSSPIKLGSEKIPYFASSRAFGDINIVSYANSNFYIQIDAPDGKIEQLFSHSFQSNAVIENMTSISYFELSIPSISTQNIQFYNISFVSSYQEELGNLTIKVCDHYINLTTKTQHGIIFNQPIATGNIDGEYRINLLNPDYKLYKIIESNPYNLTKFHEPFDLYLILQGSGIFYIEGKHFIDYSCLKTYHLGTIKYSVDSTYFPDQSYIYESGAMVIYQPEGNTMLFPPSFSFNDANISLLLINITSPLDQDAVSGFGTYSIQTNFDSISHMHLRCTHLNVTLYTSYPEAWFKCLNKSYNISTGYLTVTITKFSNSIKIHAEANRDFLNLLLTTVNISALIDYT